MMRLGKLMGIENQITVKDYILNRNKNSLKSKNFYSPLSKFLPSYYPLSILQKSKYTLFSNHQFNMRCFCTTTRGSKSIKINVPKRLGLGKKIYLAFECTFRFRNNLIFTIYFYHQGEKMSNK